MAQLSGVTCISNLKHEDILKKKTYNIFITFIHSIPHNLSKFHIFIRICWEEPKLKQSIFDLPESTRLAAKYGYVRMLEMFVEKGYKMGEAIIAPEIAIFNKQVDALAFLLNNGADFTPEKLTHFYGSELDGLYGKTTDKDAGVTLPTILKFWGLMRTHDIKPFLRKLIKLNFYHCTEIFIKYVSDNPLCNISELVLSASGEESDLNLLELAGRDSEETFIVLLKYIDLDEILLKPRIYHILLSKETLQGTQRTDG